MSRFPVIPTIFDVHFLDRSDRGYRAKGREHKARRDEGRPVWGGRQRDPGQVLGGLVERCVRRHLGARLGPSLPDILVYRELRGTVRAATLYRELDYVTSPAPGVYILWEMKATHTGRIARAAGLGQLDAAAAILAESGRRAPRVLRRLVYVAEVPVAVLEGAVPHVALEDVATELGVVFVHPDDVERAASYAGIGLPFGWAERFAPAPDLAPALALAA